MAFNQIVELPRAAQVRAAAEARMRIMTSEPGQVKTTTKSNPQIVLSNNTLKCSSAWTTSVAADQKISATKSISGPSQKAPLLPPFCEEPQQNRRLDVVKTKSSTILPTPNEMHYHSPLSKQLLTSDTEALVEELQNNFTIRKRKEEKLPRIPSLDHRPNLTVSKRVDEQLLNVNQPLDTFFDELYHIPYHDKRQLVELKHRLDNLKLKGKKNKKAFSYEYRIGRILFKHRVQHPLADLYAVENMRMDKGLDALFNAM